MKKYMLLFILLINLTISFSQKKKKSETEKAPTQKEMSELMKEMQLAMDEMDPEDKKMMDSLGIKMPSVPAMPKVSDKQLAEAWEEDGRIVPKKNTSAIAAIPATPTTTALPAFIATVNDQVMGKVTPAQRSEAETIYNSLKGKPEVHVGNTAVGLWINGSPILAILIMGKATRDNSGEVDYINNYASMLTMTGAEQAAIPMLQNINRRFPNNSTILNNLGQAWFGLGDMDKASRFLDSAIRIYPFHSQANLTKSKIEESKGNKTAAAEALVRSIKNNHSVEKENKLKKLGKKVSGKDLNFPFPMPQDPLGLERFNWPEYPMTVAESQELEPLWKLFKEKCQEEINKLSRQSARLEQSMVEATQKRMSSVVKNFQAGQKTSVLPFYAPVAIHKLSYLVDDSDGAAQHRMDKIARDLKNTIENDVMQQEIKEANEKIIEEKYDPLIGEGRPNPFKAYCNDMNDVRSKYLESTNSAWKKLFKAMLEEERMRLNAQAYYSQYINWPDEFEVIKISSKIRWLTLIRDQVVKFQPKGPFCVDAEEEGKDKLSEPLRAFDDVACQYKSSFDLTVIEFNNNCSRLEGKLKLGAINYTRKIDSDDNNKLLAASFELIVGAEKNIHSGPVQAGAKAKMTGKAEWNENEITNWEFKSEVGANVGSDLGHGDKSIDIAGMEAQIGMNSGSSFEGKGLLRGVSGSRK
jgi:tetratricopeptide (TPR) repeat protein